jgi:transcriptional regulator with XRE-family HTH domain
MTAETAPRAEIARRVEYWRKRRGLTRRLFADRMGRSVSWVDMIRRGDRQLDRLSVLEQIAEVLEISVYALIDREQARRAAECVDAVEVRLIRDALQRYDSITHVFSSEDPPEKPGLPRLARQVEYAWLTFQASHYSTLGPLLGQLLIQAQRAAAEATGDDQRIAAELLAQVYQITTSTLRKLGNHDLEWLAAERGVLAAERTGNAVLIGGAAFRLVNALLDNDGAKAAVSAAAASAHRLEADLDVERPEPSSVYGHIFLQGAVAAGLSREPGQVTSFLDEAGRIASRLGVDRNDYWTAFGPTNVEIHRVSAYVELRDWAAALGVAERMDQHHLSLLPKERRANHLVDVARACALGGRTDDAVGRLVLADTLAPKEVRCRPLAREVVHDLWRRSRRSPSQELRQLVEHVGLPA